MSERRPYIYHDPPTGREYAVSKREALDRMLASAITKSKASAANRALFKRALSDHSVFEWDRSEVARLVHASWAKCVRVRP